MSKYVFVYGTLKRGEINERLMDGTKFITTGTIANAGLVSTGYFPGLVLGKCPPSCYARGEVYEIYRSYVLPTLDHLESEGRLFKRVVVPVMVEKTTDKTQHSTVLGICFTNEFTD